mmetsp:Transcript_50997/g.111620  ORF Transcript_50997/g.111620 Transcript_50997/m.111620 type:complete len:115 (+) Transcript_50997:1-345(+)
MAFTSPPYFNTEQYSEEPTQSHMRFPSVGQWCEGFLRKTIENTMDAVKPGGYMLISISGRRMHRRAGLDMVAETIRAAEDFGAILEKTLWMQNRNQSADRALPIYVFKKAARVP